MNWASTLGPNAPAQAERTASMPFVFPHLALMPDAHLGKGSTVGSVIPTLGAIMPAAVGEDIGCGMMAVRTQFTAEDMHRGRDLASLREDPDLAYLPEGIPEFLAYMRDLRWAQHFAFLNR